MLFNIAVKFHLVKHFNLYFGYIMNLQGFKFQKDSMKSKSLPPAPPPLPPTHDFPSGKDQSFQWR